MKFKSLIITAVLALTMVLALCTTAFAGGKFENGGYARFKGSAWGYGKVTNNYGKDKKVCVRKGSITYCIDADSKKDWALLYHLSPIRENILAWYDFGQGKSLMEILSTHPSLERRVAALEKIESEMRGY